jgi:dienelactone hydrolase
MATIRRRSAARSSVPLIPLIGEVTLLLSSAMRVPRRLAISAGAVFLALSLAAGCHFVFDDVFRGGAFVVKAAGMHGWARSLAEFEAGEVTEQRHEIPGRNGPIPARTYRPSRVRGRAFLLVPGVHASGVDEPRLVGFARDLASVGHTVVTAGPPDLARYAITPATTDAIEDAARWVSAARDLAPDGRISMMGISFAGGLSLVAAGRDSLRDRVAAVVSLGGHGDLSRTLRYLCSGDEPRADGRTPHDYGVVIILLAVADRVVPAAQVEPLRNALLTFLEASRLDLVDKAQSAATFKKAVAIEAGLPEPARTLMNYVNQRDVAHLGPILRPHVTGMGAPATLSPGASRPPAAPVYLLHGLDDNVIPSYESVALAYEYQARRVTTHLLVTPLITHAEVDRPPSLREVWQLIYFWGSALGR